MKTNFLGKYNDVQKLLDFTELKSRNIKSQSSDGGNGNFEHLLQTVEGHKNAHTASSQARSVGVEAQIIQPEVQFHAYTPEFRDPAIENIDLLLSPEGKNEGKQIGLEEEESTFSSTGYDTLSTFSSLKSPKLLRVRRIGDTTDFANLSRNEQFREIKNLVEEAGSKHRIDPTLSLAVIATESSFDHRAVSTDGKATKGLFQLKDSTGRDLMNRVPLEHNSDYKPFDPKMNVQLGVSYLRYLQDIFQQPTDLKHKLTTVPAKNFNELEKIAVAAFNAGEGRVVLAQQKALRAGKDASSYEQIKGYLPGITQRYVQKVLNARESFKSAYIG
jgi:hypothetical protein